MSSDVNVSLGTVTNDPANTINWSTPSYANDGNASTGATVGFHGAGNTFRLLSDLGVDCAVASAFVKTGYAMDLDYSTDGVAWHSPASVTWTVGGGGFNITWSGGAITARYWRLGRTAAGLGSTETINTWTLTGDPVLDDLIASFTADPIFAVAGTTISFTDTTEGVPDGWSWTFGDAGTASTQNPTHIYAAPGRFTVALTATRSSDSASDTATRTEYVIVVATLAGLFIDWNGDGFDVGDHDDISSAGNVIDWRINRGSGAEIIGGSQPGGAVIHLKNPSDIYNPRNASSPLYGLIRDGVPVWIGPNSDGVLTGSDPRGLFGGRITDVTLIPGEGTGDPPTVEIVCEDALGWYRRSPVVLDYVEGRSHAQLRGEALTAAAESRFDLAHEIHTMPLSHADSDLLTVLDAINAINGTRHFAKPADLYTDWYAYTTRNRQWRLDATVDSSLSASSDHVTETDGWRLSADTVINRQKATITPIVFTPATFTVWEADVLPFDVTDVRPYSRIVSFDDVVSGSALNLSSTGDPLTATYTPFASAGKIDLSVGAGDTATVTHLTVDGSLARRLEQQSYQADDATSQAAPRGIREGSEIGNEYLGVIASAQGIALHVVWRYGNPQLRPTLTVINWLPDQFDLDLYDVIAFTSTQLGMSAVLFEIVGLTHVGEWASDAGVLHTVTYVLQESRVQSTYDWFYLDSGPDSAVLDGDFHLAA